MKMRPADLWALVNQSPSEELRLATDPTALGRLFHRYYFNNHWQNLLIVVVFSSTAGLAMFAYAWLAQVIADDIIEVQLLAVDQPAAWAVDPAHPGEYRRFALDIPDRQQGSVVDRLDARPGKSVDEKLALLWLVGGAILLIELVRHASQAIMMERTIYVAGNVQYRLRQTLHEKLHRLPMSYHDRHSPGRLMTHLFSDVAALQQHMTELLRNLPSSIIAMAVGLAIVLTLNVSMGLIVLVALPTYAVCYQWFRSRMQTLNENLREREGRLNAQVANRISNFQVIKSFGRETGESLAFLRRARGILQQYLGVSILDTGFVVTCGVISGTCITLILWMGTLQVRDGAMSLGHLLLFYAAAGYLFTPMATLTTLAAHQQRLRVVAGKIMRVLDEPLTLTDPRDPAAPPRETCELRFENVTHVYQPQRPAALRDITFTLPAGKRMAVMGPSGSGKSALAKLACRLYDPTEGSIRVNDIDLRDFRIADLRRLVGYVSQEAIVFSGTIAENISYGSPSARLKDLMTSAQYAQIHDFIEQLPQRYRTLTHERGLTLSGGQKQRVGLARSLLMGTPVLLLDDVTSALDAQTEQALMQGFESVLADRTVILITHRLSIARACDYVLMLDRGEMVAFGSPDELLMTDGPFAQLVKGEDMDVLTADSPDPAGDDFSGALRNGSS